MQASLFAGEFAHVREGRPQPDEHEADEVRFRRPTGRPRGDDVRVRVGTATEGASAPPLARRGRCGPRCARRAPEAGHEDARAGVRGEEKVPWAGRPWGTGGVARRIGPSSAYRPRRIGPSSVTVASSPPMRGHLRVVAAARRLTEGVVRRRCRAAHRARLGRGGRGSRTSSSAQARCSDRRANWAGGAGARRDSARGRAGGGDTRR
jgi:hypothetical protein